MWSILRVATRNAKADSHCAILGKAAFDIVSIAQNLVTNEQKVRVVRTDVAAAYVPAKVGPRCERIAQSLLLCVIDRTRIVLGEEHPGRVLHRASGGANTFIVLKVDELDITEKNHPAISVHLGHEFTAFERRRRSRGDSLSIRSLEIKNILAPIFAHTLILATSNASLQEAVPNVNHSRGLMSGPSGISLKTSGSPEMMKCCGVPGFSIGRACCGAIGMEETRKGHGELSKEFSGANKSGKARRKSTNS